MTELITKSPDGTVFACNAGDTILRAALRAGIGMPYSCNTGSCGNCRFELLEGSVRHLRDAPPAWSERDLKRNRWLGCQAAPNGPCKVKFRAMEQYIPPIAPQQRRAEITDIAAVTRDISEFSIRIEGDVAFKPGQYALFHVPGVDGERAYSMSNLASDGVWRFMIKHVPGGAATDWLFGAAQGAGLMLDGPYGTAFLDPQSPRDIVLMAGGSGLSPIVSIAHGAAEAGMLGARKLHVYYGARQVEDLVEASILGQVAGAQARFVPVLSDPAPGSGWRGMTGFLHDAVAAEMGPDLAACEIYFAGPAAMSEATQKMAHEAGVPQSQMHFDAFY